ncbi:LysR family transcriptional regulator [Neiella marina]|uniref:LysR family transcriptional regulator n=1 Tax=Neiella marina TaxID=508461 RepID=A0A8J2U335_9GAMM|nr:LysR family transcriptional regulator [Neiella marina]GGA69680.1 LysR family transcriptional regulator [Neiella marina]
MDVKVFRTFLQLAEQKHFGKAAESLYITQAAVSARIKQLETFFDNQLFVRERNAIRLTSAGERLIPYAQAMVRTLEQAKTDLALASNQSIQLTLAGTANIWDAFLQHWLTVVTDTMSGYSFSAEVMNREQIHRSLVERTLDIGISFDPLKADDVVSQHIADLELALVSSEPTNIDTVFDSPYIYVDWGNRFSLEHADRHPAIAAPFMRTSSGRIALDFILKKGGAAYLPSSVVEPFITSEQLFEVQNSARWSRPVYFCNRRQAVSAQAISRVRELFGQTEPEPAQLFQQASEATSNREC